MRGGLLVSCRAPRFDSVRTEKGGEDGVGGGLHPKHTSPEEAFVVQREERRGSSRSFNPPGLKEEGGAGCEKDRSDTRRDTPPDPPARVRLWT